jgi:hypothetical protein
MGTFEIRYTYTHRSLMHKSKSELADLVLYLCDRLENAEARLQTERSEGERWFGLLQHTQEFWRRWT